MSSRRSAEAGYAVTWLVLLLPVMIIFMGLVLDGALIFLRSQMLDAATDAAALAATGAWDRDHWLWHGKVRIDPDEATGLAHDYLGRNMPDARLVEVKVHPANRVTVRTQSTAPLFFLKIVGWEQHKVESYSSAVRRGAN